MVDEILDKILKNHGNKEFSHEERCTVVHLPFILMEITFLPFPWTFTTNSEDPCWVHEMKASISAGTQKFFLIQIPIVGSLLLIFSFVTTPYLL